MDLKKFSRLLVRGGSSFAQQRGIHTAEEVRRGTALIADNGIYVLTLTAAGQGCRSCCRPCLQDARP